MNGFKNNNMFNRHNFQFGSWNSKSAGFVMTGNVFSFPERDVETISVEGMDGDLLRDNGRFKNITVTYSGGIPQDFLWNIGHLHYGILDETAVGKYRTLWDTYYPKFYRYARFLNASEPSPLQKAEAGKVNVSFSCKPQLYLKCSSCDISYANGGLGTIDINNSSNNHVPILFETWVDNNITIDQSEYNHGGIRSYISGSLIEAVEGGNEYNIYNPTYFFAKPRIWIKKMNGGYINNFSINFIDVETGEYYELIITNCQHTWIEVDSETMTARVPSNTDTNGSKYISGEFPILSDGTTRVSFDDSNYSVYIEPRFYVL